MLAWRTSNTLTTNFCVAVLQEAPAKYGRPEIFNTDQGSQFTSLGFTKVHESRGVRISMDGKGRFKYAEAIGLTARTRRAHQHGRARALDGQRLRQRLLRSVKYEEVYLRAYGSIAEADRRIGAYIDFYNRIRSHQGLDGLTPDAAYFGAQPTKAAA